MDEKQLELLTEIVRQENQRLAEELKDKMLYSQIVNGLVSVKGFAVTPTELKKKADELFFGLTGGNTYKY